MAGIIVLRAPLACLVAAANPQNAWDLAPRDPVASNQLQPIAMLFQAPEDNVLDR